MDTQEINRRIRNRYVIEYAASMVHWVNTGETIKFDRRGKLVDGQHRLLAVIESGMSVWMAVALNVDDDAQKVMDSGLKRTIADNFGMEDVKNSGNVAAAVRFLLALEKGQIKSPQTSSWPSSPRYEHHGYFAVHGELEDTVAAVSSQWRAVPQTVTATAVSYFLCSQKDPELADQFFSELAQHATEGLGDPKATLLQRLWDEGRRKSNRTRNSLVTNTHMTHRAWNAVRKGEKLYKIPTSGVDYCMPI